ncbi:MAG: universal stress protein [Anaerolineae bacterium]|jgi:nucleotide-binding universal stress UspA family protein
MKMLLCTIGSHRREATLGFGITVARALAAELTLLGVAKKKDRIASLAEELERRAAPLIADGLAVQVRVLSGEAEKMVLQEMEQETYDLVALGALAEKRSRRRFFDPVVVRIIEQAQTTVLAIKGGRTSLSKVLICASGTEHGHLSIWAGAGLACGAGAKATVLHIVDAMPAMYVGLEQMEETLAELLQSDSEKARELRWAAQVVKAECEVSEVKLRRGIAADEILEEGQEGNYDLIVLGSSQTAGSLRRALMGDLASEVVTRAERPVLVVRPIEH